MADLEAFQDVPDYLRAADSHNILGDGKSWFEVNPANAGKFVLATGLSAVNGFYRTAQTVGNWFSDKQTELQDTGDLISSFDSDLGKYYRENERLIDISGAIVGSILPGMAGTKGLTLLQSALNTGKLGGNLSIATNLLVPRLQAFRAASAAEINSSVAMIGNLNTNTFKALAAGIHQNVLEAAAAETMIALTMGAAPMLDNHDAGDLVKNIAMGSIFGGVVGGAIEGAKTFSFLNKARGVEDLARRPFSDSIQPRASTASSEKIILKTNDLEFSGALPLEYSRSYGVDQTLHLQRIETVLNEVRTDICTMAGGNDSLGNLVADLSQPVRTTNRGVAPGYANSYFEKFAHADEILLPRETSALEDFAAKAKLAGKPKNEIEAYAHRYISLMGDTAGAVHTDMPMPMSLGDMYHGKEGVLKALTNYDFSVKKTALPYDPLSSLKPGFKTTDVKMLYRELDARYIWASQESGRIVQLQKGMNIHENDLPLLERALQDNFEDFHLVTGSGPSLELIPGHAVNLKETLKASKERIAGHFYEMFALEKKAKYGEEQALEMVANMVNVRKGWLDKTSIKGDMEDLFARQNAKTYLQESLAKRGINIEREKLTDPMFLPKYAKVSYRIPEQADISENMVAAVTYFKARQTAYETEAKATASIILGERSSNLMDITDNMLETANRNGDSPTMLKGQNGNYGTIGSFMSFIGGQTNAIRKEAAESVQQQLLPVLSALGNKLEAAIEHEGINQKLTRSTKRFILHESPDGVNFLVTKQARDAVAKELGILPETVTLNHLDEFADDVIEVTHKETWNVLAARQKLSQTSGNHFQLLNKQRGVANREVDTSVVRPVRPDFKKYPFFSLVKDESVMGGGETSMIWAASEKELARMEDEVRRIGPHYRVINKANVEEYKIARGEYELSKAMNSYQIDSELKTKGVMSNFFPKTDPETIANEILQHHTRESDALVRETVRMRYQPAFDKLTNLGKQTSRVTTSRFGGSIAALENTSDNPYFNYIKTALDISKVNEHPIYFGAATLAESMFSKPVTAIRKAFETARTPDELSKINVLLDQFGLKPAYQTASIDLLANHTAPKGELTRFVRGANGLLSLFTLGLDPLNAVSNAISANILRGTETAHIANAIKAGNQELAGDLSKLAKIKLPGTESEILSPVKLQTKAIHNFFEDMRTPGQPLLNRYRNAGYVKDHIDQFKLLLDDLTLDGTESVGLLRTKLAQAFAKSKKLMEDTAEVGQKLSGNKLAEEFNRFVSANVMDQLTTLAQKHGIMTEKESLAYINTFVNRVDGNMIASQRPMVFQGPIGQAIGLFQSYQFNLMQQLFRYIGEGTKKDMAMLLGLQSTLYGAQSLPGFQFINSHIVGTASGNKDHVDLYDTTYGALGKNLGNWFLYGSPSFILQTNLYSRGDINPRNLTILPTHLMDIPAIGGWTKFFGNLYETASKLGSGGKVWETLLQGLEHQGISRPLAGIAQTLQGVPSGTVHSTTNQGSLLYSHDLFSLATASRLVGGRPLDEALTNDTLFRHKFYEAQDRDKRAKLAEVMKTHMMEGGSIDEKHIQQFAQSYAESGGKQVNFNRYMMELYKNANKSQAEQIRDSLGKPMSYKLQLLMDGSSSFNH
jgi:hypothetical protein